MICDYIPLHAIISNEDMVELKHTDKSYIKSLPYHENTNR